ncbi:hypothetical protein MYCTH_2066229, partial [Thermothelomyces thermophilus ATCC 42464]
FMPSNQGEKPYFLLEVRNDLIGFIEAEVLPNKLARAVKNFINYNIFLLIVVNRGSKFKGEVKAILEELGVKCIIISPYNSRANNINKARYIPIIATLAKITVKIRKN